MEVKVTSRLFRSIINVKIPISNAVTFFCFAVLIYMETGPG